MNDGKYFVYIVISNKKGCTSGITKEETQEIKEKLINFLEKFEYEFEIDALFECDVNTKKIEQKSQRLIDANNIDWNGLLYSEALKENVDFLLSRQKEIIKNNYYDGFDCGYLLSSTLKCDDPCENCKAIGTLSCQNECPYNSY